MYKTTGVPSLLCGCLLRGRKIFLTANVLVLEMWSFRAVEGCTKRDRIRNADIRYGDCEYADTRKYNREYVVCKINCNALENMT